MQRHDRSKTAVLLACGPMTNRFCSSVDRVRASLRRRGYKAAYVDIALPESPLSLHGCCDHPTIAEDAQCKNLALGTLRDLTGWR